MFEKTKGRAVIPCYHLYSQVSHDSCLIEYIHTLTRITEVLPSQPTDHCSVRSSGRYSSCCDTNASHQPAAFCRTRGRITCSLRCLSFPHYIEVGAGVSTPKWSKTVRNAAIYCIPDGFQLIHKHTSRLLHPHIVDNTCRKLQMQRHLTFFGLIYSHVIGHILFA